MSLAIGNYSKFKEFISFNQRHNMVKWVKKKKERDSTICYLQETHLSFKETHRQKVKVWESNSMQMDTNRELE